MNFIQSALCAAALTVCANANADLNVATVDIQKIMDGYYKTHDVVSEANKAYKEVQKIFNTRTETIKAMEIEFTDMTTKLKDPMLNEKDKEALKQKAEIKRQELIALDKERKSFVDRQLKSLQERMKKETSVILTEINTTTEAIAKAGKYDIVMDKSAKTPRANNVFMYTSPSLDITDSILKELNKNAPAGFDPTKKPGQSALPETPAAPAAK